MALWLPEADVRTVLNMPDLIEAMQAALTEFSSGAADQPLRNGRPVRDPETPTPLAGRCVWRCLTMTYFRRDGPDYHRRWRVSRSCSRWEGVVPRRYGRQT